MGTSYIHTYIDTHMHTIRSHTFTQQDPHAEKYPDSNDGEGGIKGQDGRERDAGA
jgi:hypothetical protein